MLGRLGWVDGDGMEYISSLLPSPPPILPSSGSGSGGGSRAGPGTTDLLTPSPAKI